MNISFLHFTFIKFKNTFLSLLSFFSLFLFVASVSPTDAFNDILLHVNHVTHPDIKVSVPIKDTHGKYIWYESLKCVQHCGPHAVRLLAYVDGELLKDVACKCEMIVECGILLARLHNALEVSIE